MLNDSELISTVEMLKYEHLDVRTVTLGISLFDCASHDLEVFKTNLRKKITRLAGNLVETCNAIGDKYGIEVVNKRISISPIGVVAAPFNAEQMVDIAKTLNDIAVEVGVDFIGGFSALVEKGMANGDRALIEAIPEALTQTDRICASVNVGSTRAGINMDAVLLMAKAIKRGAELTADKDGLAAAKLCVFCNIPQDVPFMAGAYLGTGEADAVINVGVSGPGVVKRAIDRAIEASPDLGLGDIAEIIKRTACKVTRVGELIGREVAQTLDIPFGVVDLSLAPTPTVGDSVGEIFQSLGLISIGAPGSTAALAMLNDAVKKGGAFASSHVGGLSGAFIPVSEDLNIEEACRNGFLNIEKLEAMTCVCSVGLDMVAIPGNTSEETLAGIIADEMAIGMINNKTTACRLIPVPGKGAGDYAHFGGLLGHATIIDVKNCQGENSFVRHGGRIPAPIHSLKN
ncbi:PFL family protein [Desulfoluna limicola]|uniref:PFL family protein n=1 Tax=Desulfoluna limicola TaxID=2810562 RepID=A0ABM7PCW3_9BACT|nr:PFL family protein [Desulfoluna limicola]BCS95410.1 PFL family protein [Desulfoluna limicola]